MGRWTPPPTTDPITQAHREAAEAQEALEQAQHVIEQQAASIEAMQRALNAAETTKNNAVWLQTLLTEKAEQGWREAAKRGDGWEAVAWNLLNIGYRYMDPHDRDAFHDEFKRLRDHHLGTP